MSYPYKVVVTKTVVEQVEASDRSESKLSLLPILPEDRMRDLVAEALRKRGFEQKAGDPDKLTKKGERGETITVDLPTLTVTAEVSEKGEIRKEKTVEVLGDAPRPPTADDEQALRERAEKTLERQLAVTDEERGQVEDEYRRKLAAALEEGADARRRELNEVCLEVYAESLKERAKSLGTVTGVQESRGDQEYELTITIAE